MYLRSSRAPTMGRKACGAQQRRGVPSRPKRPSSWNISRTWRPCSAWRATSWRTVRRSFFKGGLRRYIRLGVPWPWHDLAPAVAVQQPVDRRGRHVLAQLLLVGPLDFRHRQHAASLGALDERRQELALLLRSEVLVTPATSASQIEEGVAFFGPARMDHMHRRRRPAQQLRDLRRRAAQRGPDQHALNALVLRVTTSLLEPISKSGHCGLVANDKRLHPRLLEIGRAHVCTPVT